eukprot:TRINITY_DN36860_c0_g1_i1.p1 TRINITY_DN36860_c0_g1~~TRINITY_DN36860_c0_g1_i1.p1  ORF type:complete len:878 (+),score=285.85 TRINITY_DN36860_c0_g1_i1:84-2636(+)
MAARNAEHLKLLEQALQRSRGGEGVVQELLARAAGKARRRRQREDSPGAAPAAKRPRLAERRKRMREERAAPAHAAQPPVLLGEYLLRNGGGSKLHPVPRPEPCEQQPPRDFAARGSGDSAVSVPVAFDLEIDLGDRARVAELQRQVLGMVQRGPNTCAAARTTIAQTLESCGCPISSALLTLLLQRCRAAGDNHGAGRTWRHFANAPDGRKSGRSRKDRKGPCVAGPAAFREAASVLEGWSTACGKAEAKEAMRMLMSVQQDLSANPGNVPFARGALHVSLCSSFLQLLAAHGAVSEKADAESIARQLSCDPRQLCEVADRVLLEYDSACRDQPKELLKPEQESFALQLLLRLQPPRSPSSAFSRIAEAARSINGSGLSTRCGALPLWAYQQLFAQLDERPKEAGAVATWLMKHAQGTGTRFPLPVLVQLADAAAAAPAERLQLARDTFACLPPRTRATGADYARVLAQYLYVEATVRAERAQGRRSSRELAALLEQVRSDFVRDLPPQLQLRLAEAMVRAHCSDRDLPAAVAVAQRLLPLGSGSVLGALLTECLSGNYTPPSRDKRGDAWKPRRALQQLRSGSADEWALRCVLSSSGLSGELCEKAVAKWRRWHSDALAKGDEVLRSKQPKGAGAEDVNLDLALLFQAAGESTTESKPSIDSLLNPEVAGELFSGLRYVAVLEPQAAEALAAQGMWERLRQLADAQGKGGVRVAMSLDAIAALQAHSREAAARWLTWYAEDTAQCLWLLPLSVTYDVATDPYRPRELPGGSGGAPNLRETNTFARCLAWRLDFAAGRQADPRQLKTVVVSADQSDVQANTALRILSCSPQELILPGGGREAPQGSGGP